MYWKTAKRQCRTAISLFLTVLLLSFLIVDDGGYVAVRDLCSGSTERTQTRTELLPPSDVALLNDGILCNNETELAATLENFCS